MAAKLVAVIIAEMAFWIASGVSIIKLSERVIFGLFISFALILIFNILIFPPYFL